MIGVLIISIISIVAFIGSIVLIPNIKIGNHSFSTCYFAPLIGAILLLATGLLPFDSFWAALTSNSAVNPIQILVIFFSMVFMSIVLDEVGFFRFLASVAAKKAKQSQTTLFFLLYFFVSFLTVFTSNDIIVITFTPFIIFFARHAKISPLPYLVGEFVAANTWSTLLLVGNPTNIYLSSAFNIDFFQYTEMMFIPTIFAGLASLTIIYLLFRKILKDPINTETQEEHIIDKPIFIVSFVLLASCIVLLAISSWVGLPMWMIALGSASVLFIFVLIYGLINRKEFFVTTDSLKRLPYNLIPLLLGMFAIVLALENSGVTEGLYKILNSSQPILTYGVTSFVFANILNNIPMSVLFTEVLKNAGAPLYQGIYATILSSNLAAFFTPVGALAGVMWMSLLKQNDIRFTFLTFIKYGLVISIPSLLIGLGGLYLSFFCFG